MISGVTTPYTVSQFTEFWVLVRITDDGWLQPKHVAVDWCHVCVCIYVYIVIPRLTSDPANEFFG